MLVPVSVQFSLNQDEFLHNYEIQVISYPQFDFLIVNNVPTAQSGFELSSQLWFKTNVYSHTNLFGIKFKINEKIDEKFNKNPDFSDLGSKNSFLVAFQSIMNEHESKTYWKIMGRDQFYSTYIDDDSSEAVTIFCHGFLINQIRYGKGAVLPDFKGQQDIRLDEICSETKENLLMSAASCNQPNIVMELLKRDFDINFGDVNQNTAIDYAWTSFINSIDESDRKISSEIILHLLNMNSVLPNNFNYTEATKEVQDFVDMCDRLHQYLDDLNFESINQQLDKNPNMIYFYDKNNFSLLLHALSMSNIGVDFILNLLSRKLNFGPHEALYEHEAINLKNLQQINSKEFPETHILKLRSRTQIGNNHEFLQEYWNLVDDAFKTLNKNELCSKILKVAAECKLVKLYFDFKHDTVHYMDPTGGKSSKGRTYMNGIIYIGAKFLKDQNRKFLVLSYLAHELCHVVMLLTFFNPNFDPFPMGESAAKTRYLERVIVECESNKGFEEIVGNVFKSYDPEFQSSELIVTVPQMMMHYIQNSDRMQELRGVYLELFGYVEQIVVPELDMALNVLKLLNDEKRDIEFENLTAPMRARISHKEIILQGQETSFFKLAECDERVLKFLSSEQIRRILIKNEKLNFGKVCAFKMEYELQDRNFIAQEVLEEHGSTYKWNQEELFQQISKNQKNFETVKNEVKFFEVFILADHAGSGKTTTFMNYAIKLKASEENSWVSYVRLRKFGEVFEKYKNSTGYISMEQVAKILAELVGLSPDANDQHSKIEFAIFEKLLMARKVILLLDGIDEVCPKYEQVIIKILSTWNDVEAQLPVRGKFGFNLMFPNRKVAKRAQNQLWISTRPHYAGMIKKIFGIVVHMFSPFTNVEKQNLILNILRSKRIEDEHKQKEMIESISVCLEYLGVNSISKNVIDNALMIKMITELFIQDPKRHSIYNVYELYSAMIEMQKNELSEKISGEDRDPQSRLNIWQVHHLLALKDIIDGDERYVLNISDFSIMKMWKKEKKIWTPHKIERYGLVNVNFSSDANDNEIHIDFMHKTISEFFIAQFIVESIFDDNVWDRDEDIERKFELLHEVITYQGFDRDVIGYFIICYIRNQAYVEKKVYHEIIKRKVMETIDGYDGYGWKKFIEAYREISSIDNEIRKKLFKFEHLIRMR